MIERTAQDVRHAVRLMARYKGFTTAALITLALGIGANTAIFSIVYGVLLRPLPYGNAERMIRVWEEHPGGAAVVRAPLLSNRTFHQWLEARRTIDHLAAFKRSGFTLGGTGEPVRVAAAEVSPALFTMTGAVPAAGRLLVDDDAAEGASQIAVLSYGFWHERFAADPAAVGRALTLDGRSITVVGVAPPGFYFPDREVRMWLPYRVPRVSTDPAQQQIDIFGAIARLRPGATAEQAAAEGTSAARGAGPRGMIADLIFGKGGPVEVRTSRLIDDMTSRVRPALLLLAVGVGFVLLIACANVANLLLSRGVARQRELAVRSAIGAGRRRLAVQLVTETLVLAVAGGALGVLLAWLLIRVLPALAPADFPRIADIHMDGTTLMFGCAASVLAGLLSGVLPGLRASTADLAGLLRSGVSPGTRTRRLGAGLLLVEAALCVLLLVGSGLLIRSFGRLAGVNPGYDANNVLLARLYFSAGERPAAATLAVIDSLLARLRSAPGVTSAGASNMAPFVRATAVSSFSIPGTGADGQPLMARALNYVVTPGYAEALSLRLVEGRLFEPADFSAGAMPMLVNEEFARAYLNDGRPVVGRQFPGGGEAPPREIVGVVGNVLKDGLDSEPQSEIYVLPRGNHRFTSQLSLVVRTAGDPLAVVPVLRSIVRDVDPSAAVDDVAPLATRMSESMGQPRFSAAVLALFAIAALALAATGLYGVLSYQVLQRRREMGVRAALGASRGRLLALVLREGLAVTVAGLVLGLGAAALLTRLMEGLLFGVTPLDAPAFLAAPIVLLAVALLACLLPARRAAGVDPAEALRAE
ncbi:MAG TPA: ABC transporter permease [Vicinamibacterales bacterium]|nr:ABC transporter permease [Vicinamibacterales bacterium]